MRFTAFVEIIVSIDDPISGHGVGYTFCIDVAALLTADLVLDVRIRLVRDEDLTRWSHLFEPGREICAAADDGVIQMVLAAEVTDGTETCVDASPAP